MAVTQRHLAASARGRSLQRRLGFCIGQAFHQGCSLPDVALATGLAADQVIAIGKRTIRRTKGSAS